MSSCAPGTCLDDDRILLLLEGKLTAAARAEAEAHLDECEACRLVVGAAAPTDEVLSRRGLDLGRGVSVGRYLMLSLIGRGGMGRVYAAYDPDLDRRVAVKLLHAAAGFDDARRRMAREARALGKLSHPNVVQVYDVGEHDGEVFVAMELVEGEPLDRFCRRTPKPRWQEVLPAFLDAARGISAAHHRGLVHRDVKPSNILRGKDGRVRVADFGLATASEQEDPATAPPPSVNSPFAETLPAPPSARGPMTAIGSLVGTPLYMAPEQHEGRHATAASDQYSLCVALYEALYGELPFAFDPGPFRRNARLLEAKKSGPPAAPPAGSPVPRWIFKAIARGLGPAPEDRHPSLDALVAALQDDPEARKRRRRRSVALAVAGAGLLAAGTAGVVGSGAFRSPCQHPERQLAGVWDEGVKARVQAALLGTGRSSAEETAVRVSALLDHYGAEWSKMRGEVCEEIRREPQRREILGRRDACLERRRGQLEALTTLLADKPDPEVLDKAVAAAAELYPISYCADTEALAARVRPPEDPALRARVAALQPRLDRVEALFKAGKFQDGLALGGPLLAETTEIPYAPLRAQVELAVGRLRTATGDYEGAKTLIRRATVSAAEGSDDRLAAAAWADLVYVVAERQKRFEEASVILALGPTAVVRAQDAQTQATWSSVEGILLVNMGKYAEAKVAHEHALALREKALGPDHPDTAISLHNLGIVLCAMGDCWRAKALFERALAIKEKVLGPEHPDTTMSLGNLGNVLRRVGDYPGALAVHRRALAVKERALGPDHPSVASSLTNLGNVLFETGDYEGALAVYQRALAIKEKVLGPDHADLASTLVGIGRAEVRRNQLDAALPALERARAVREQKLGAAHPELAGILLGLGELHLARGAPAEAVPVLGRALALENAEFTSELQLTLAEALWRRGEDRSRARALAEQVRAAYERLHHGPGLARVLRWLAEHPLDG